MEVAMCEQRTGTSVRTGRGGVIKGAPAQQEEG